MPMQPSPIADTSSGLFFPRLASSYLNSSPYYESQQKGELRLFAITIRLALISRQSSSSI